ncbi:MAG: amidohydrolase family protein, partial [Burkholderiaceae bacterium]
MSARHPFDPTRWPERLPPSYWLRGAHVPADLLDRPAAARPTDPVALLIDGARIAAIEAQPQGELPAFDLDGATVLPAFVDPHTHLDKGDLLAVGLEPSRSLFGAIEAVQADQARWTPAELAARIDFGLQEAWAHGTRALNSYCDWWAPDAPLAWQALQEARERWHGRVELVLTSLAPVDLLADPAASARLARQVAQAGGVLGWFAYAAPHVSALLPRAFDLAERLGLRLDFHIDEHLDASQSHTLAVAQLARERGWGERTVCGHACALSRLAPQQLREVLDVVAASGLSLVSLPLTNLYLQDSSQQTARRTPRWRGLAPVHEASALGIPVAFGSDNHRDCFSPLGDLDPLRTLALAACAAQLDDAVHQWGHAITRSAAAALGLAW